MDSLTHIAIGACIGEAFFEKGFGKKAMLWGALAQSIPDIDFVSHLWLSDAEALLAHRGFTHSFLFAAFAVPLFALTADKFHASQNIGLKKWSVFFLIQLLLHLLLDSMNNYGIGWLEPFSHQRFAFNLIYVVDPFFSVFSWVACIALFFLHSHSHKRIFWWKLGVYTFSFYVLMSAYNKSLINNIVQSSMQEQHIKPKRYFTSPAPLQNFLWYIVLETNDGYYISYKSLFEKDPGVHYQFYKSQHQYAHLVDNHEEFQRLIRFADHYYILDSSQGNLVFNDLRFGQQNGWETSDGPFVFRFILNHPSDNSLLIQRGRIEGWNLNTLNRFIRRVLHH